MDDAFDAGAVERDEGRRPDSRTARRPEQMPHAAQISRAFFTHGGREQHRSPGFDPSLGQRFTYGNQRCEASRVIRDTGPLEPRASARNRNVEFRTEHRIEVSGQDDTVASYFPYPVPRPHVTDLIDRDIVQAGIGEHLRHAGPACPLGAGGGGNRRQRRLARQCRFVGALDVGPRGADAIVGEQGVDHGAKV